VLRQTYRKVRYAILLTNVGGPKVLFRQFWRQVYSAATFVGLERSLVKDGIQIPCSIKYSSKLASNIDVKEVLKKARTESRDTLDSLNYD
jgi:hypothetical protein